MIAEDQQGSHSDEELVYWLAFEDKSHLLPTRKAVRVFDHFKSLKALWQVSNLYNSKFEIDDHTIRNLATYINRTRLSDVKRILGNIKSNHYNIIRYVDKEYPNMLRNMRDPPLFVLHKGPLFNFDNCIAIVGTRDPSFYGRMMAKRISKSLALRGYTIASGLARGIDEWAHCGALEASRGRTIAVLAWMNPIYPSEHRQLADDIIKKGAIISERFMNPKDKSGPSKFVQRNRITSGISRCVIAVESGKEGGTVHQIRIALDQRRKVFALKPKESNKRAKEGFNVFMDMGATPIKSARDLLKHLQEDLPGKERKLDSFSQHSIDRF